MNERIRLLAEQAGFFPDPNWDHTDWHAAGHSDLFEKFAELIVRECADIVLAPHNEAMMSVSMDLCKFSTREAINRAAQSGGLKVHTQGIANQIREHFGVGE